VALFIERLGEQGIEGRGNKEIEMPDTREIAQDRWHSGRQLLHQRPNARVDFFPTAALLQVAADDRVRCVFAGAALGGHAQALGEFQGEQALQREFSTRAVGHGKQLATDDRNHASLFDELEQIVPEEILLG
jgi:hypothetical protein